MTGAPIRVAPARTFPISRKRQVRWFDTRQLVATGSQALAAGIIGSMSGRRELMAALDPGAGSGFDYSAAGEELWLDYIADTGDGWNAASSVLWLAGRDGLLVGPGANAVPQPIPPSCLAEERLQPEPGETLIPGGKLLILGGDQVYPTASPLAYQQRLTDPLRCARYYEEHGRDLFAVPGNHDWYDGLTAFIRLFCQTGDSRRWFGAWRAQQRRSYFSIQLPHGWWLWGLDTALEDDLDPPQYDYFRVQAEELRDGDRLILCVPAPTWLEAPATDLRRLHSRRVDKLGLIMEVALRKRQVEVPLVLTGDHHYYARHEATLAGGGKRQYIICGGGGAFGLGTLQVPEEIRDIDGKGADALRGPCFPDEQQSVDLRRGVIGFAFENWAFTGLLTFAHLITFWLLSVAGPAPSDPARDGAEVRAEQAAGWIGRLMDRKTSLAELWTTIAEVGARAVSSPALLLWLLLFAIIVIAFAGSGRPRGVSRGMAWIAGGIHALLQIGGAFLCVWLAAQLVGLTPWGSDPADWKAQWAAPLLAALLLYLYSGTLFGLYLLTSHKALGLHDQEVFSAQGIEDYRSFLRMRLSPEGLHVYPLGLQRSARKWKAAGGVTLTPPDINIFSKDQLVSVPEGCRRVLDPCEPLRPHLIEGAIFIPGAARPAG